MDQNPKQEVAEKLRSSANVLITVAKNPDVDQLTAAIGLSLMLNRMDKNTAGVFSGQIPDVLSFLEPEKTFDNSIDSLRDFIISLSKDKADKLRYKVEDDVVKIFITPYKTELSQKDFEFSQGDYNVDVVIALGVKKKADLDEAITAHGRILHDASIISINAGAIGGEVGSLDWSDPNASSLCEMLVSISEALEGGILDGPMSTAFLTGIVSVTDRFSNDKTTPKLMTMAAQLMAAGANQQLISEKLMLDNGKLMKKPPKSGGKKDASTLDLSQDRDKGKDNKKPQQNQNKQGNKPHKPKLNKNDIPKDLKLDELEQQLQEMTDDEPEPTPQTPPTPPPQNNANPPVSLPPIPQQQPPQTPPPPSQPKPENIRDLKSHSMITDDTQISPKLGGTFNATSKEALQEKMNERKDGFNDEILTHGPPSPTNTPQPQPTEQAHMENTLDDARRAVEQATQSIPHGDAPQAAMPEPQMNQAPIQDQFSQPMPPGMPPAQAGSPPPMAPPMPPQGGAPMPPPQGPAPNTVPPGVPPAQTFNIPQPGVPQQNGQPFPPQPGQTTMNGMPPPPQNGQQMPPPPPPGQNFPPPPQ